MKILLKNIWELDKFEYPWPTPDLTIYKTHVIKDLVAATSSTPVKQHIFVQCLNDSPEEARDFISCISFRTEWVMSLAKDNPEIKGIVAGLDPSHPQFEERLISLKKDVPLLVGVRHILDLEPRQDYLLREDVAAGMRVLARHNLTFDLLLRPPIIEAATVLVRRVPEVRFVVDHLAKPYIAAGKLEPWRQHMTELAKYPNVYCKLSGMITEADLESWKPENFQPYIEHMVQVFGPDRLMFGSDWPVCRLAKNTDYATVYITLKKHLSHLPDEQQKKIYCTNARKFYSIV
ncbi:hypothetical protein SK128_024506 [Halocaridina rubra]|uniref:Amidohydrolase-related domain-containing protein n=1 Tax=Halocaridina rubra TaxID=373956 RepID=A0AAN9A250_HALRR